MAFRVIRRSRATSRGAKRFPHSNSFVTGVDRELMPHVALQVNYSYTRTTNLFGNLTANITPRVGVTLADYTVGPTLAGPLPDGTSYSVPTFVSNGAKVNAGGGGFLTTTVPGYSTDYHGLELALVKRLSEGWMGRVGFSYNNAREHFASVAGRYDTNGNPTPTVAEPLVDGGQFAPQSRASSGSGSVYVNANGSSMPTGCTRRRSASKPAPTCSGGRATRSRCSASRRSAVNRSPFK